MSRCFPYPPRGYLGNGSRGDSVSVSIKHQRNGTKIVPEQSTKKERGIKEKETKAKYFAGKGRPGGKESGKRKLVDYDTEKSDLSEEHGQPVQVFSGVEDKKGDEAASSVPKRNVLRFRIPLKKSKEPGVPVSVNQSAEPLKKRKEPDVPTANKTANNVLLPQPDSAIDKARQCTLELQRGSSCGNVEPSFEIPSRKSKKHKKELQYEALFRDWVPPPLEFQMEDGDEDWLFSTKKQPRKESKVVEVRNSDNLERSSCLWPTARFLPEADIYSLPYSIPF